MKLRVLAAKFEGRRWSVSRGIAWDVGVGPSFVLTYGDTEHEVISDQKKNDPKMGQAPTSQARQTQTTYGPQTWQRGLSA